MRYLKQTFDTCSDWIVSNLLPLLLTLFVCIGGFVVLYPRIVILVPAGSVGVLYRAFGGGVVQDYLVNEGVNFILPWNTVTQYNSRIQVKSLELEVLTSDLLKSKVKVTFQFEVNRLTLPLLHKYVGPHYVETMVIPEVTSVTREMFAKLKSDQAFTTGISQVVRDIAINADRVIIDKLSPPGLSYVRLVRISAVQLESIIFPTEIQAAIEAKLVEAQVAESYVYRIDREKQEVERKVIEAGGIRQFQDIVNAGLTENFLLLKGIDATAKLAESENAKIVIFGSSPSGLPLVLGGGAADLSFKK